jgi:hypothetical protein
MLNKTFALALALAAAPVSSLLAAGGTPNGENATSNVGETTVQRGSGSGTR